MFYDLQNTPHSAADASQHDVLLAWCGDVLGPFDAVANHTRDHPGDRVAAWRLHTSLGDCYVKTYQDPTFWAYEVHGYEQWASAFGDFAPKLLGVRDEAPLAIIISALPGTILEEARLTVAQERAVWRAAGRALVALHELTRGTCFGPCRRDGTCVGPPIADAEVYLASEFEDWINRGHRGGWLTADELVTVDAARSLLSAFEGEPPVPCHRDYGPANWLVNEAGAWAGVIDFEFAYWNVRIDDFSRYPNWEWIHRPDLVNALYEGYGWTPTPRHEAQVVVGRALYALGALVWGMENEYHGFAAEGRYALQHLSTLLR